MADRKTARLARLQEELNIGADDLTVYFDADGIVLAEAGGALVLCAGSPVFTVTSSGYEPCACLNRNGEPVTVIHSAFSVHEILTLAQKGGAIHAVTGADYDLDRVCRTLAFAGGRLAETDIGYVEGALAVEKLKALGATSPDRAVAVRALGVRQISERFSRSKKLAERVMTTEDGRVYVRIKT